MNPINIKTGNAGKTILVTDSGLGGLSVFAQIANHLKKKSPWQEVSMVYFNSWPEQDGGYNFFKSMDQRAEVFNNALNAMDEYQPDMILIACNTLSVIYPFTSYSQSPKARVAGIVDHGVLLIHENLVKDPDSSVIIFGTDTTISEKSHQKQLVKMGVDPARIINQGCGYLPGEIEGNPFSTSLPKIIEANVKKAVSKMNKPVGKVYAALCCTHFGYCKDLFHKSLSRYVNGDIIILNPNERMAEHAVQGHDIKNTFSCDINMHVVSKVFWETETINAYVRLMKNISPETAKALAGYERNIDLFKAKKQFIA
ncbi:MAG: hypothetical protein ABFR31_00050 [Thermodesulfobacteriota bacterium]